MGTLGGMEQSNGFLVGHSRLGVTGSAACARREQRRRHCAEDTQKGASGHPLLLQKRASEETEGSLNVPGPGWLVRLDDRRGR